MPAKNLYHDAVVAALIADGWTITHDPLSLVIGTRHLYVDIGADELTVGAERGSDRIAIEVQSFLRPSNLDDFYRAIGQFVVYRAALRRATPDRELFLGIAMNVYHGIFSEPLGQMVMADAEVKIVTFNPKRRSISQWIK